MSKQHSSGSSSPIAAISGGLGDIGRAVALALAQDGADIALGDIENKSGQLAGLMDQLTSLGRRCFFQSVDVADAAAVDRWYDAVQHEYGRPPDWIIPNAAIVTFKPYPELSAAEWRREMAVNLDGSFHWSHSGIKRLVREELGGRVVFVGSWAAHAPHQKLPAYSVTKAGIRMLMQTLALEYARCGILVNEVAPGYVDAGLTGQSFQQEPERRERARAAVPVGALLTPEDVARTVRFLCSNQASQITGTTLLQDGGLSLLQGPCR
jgi:glucose 1-dehydrogenase